MILQRARFNGPTLIIENPFVILKKIRREKHEYFERNRRQKESVNPLAEM
jgi:hypothetical protein